MADRSARGARNEKAPPPQSRADHRGKLLLRIRPERGVLLAVVMIIVLAGCSALKIGYNNADALLHWRAWQYFNFQGEQKDEFERRVQRFMAWHRRTALPQYAGIARDMGDRLARGLSRADLVWGYDMLHVQLRESLRAGGEEFGGLLDGLQPAQIERFQARLATENEDQAKEHGLGEAPGKQRELRVKRNKKRLEEWFGPLTEAQIERLSLYSARAPLDGGLRDRDRRRLQGELLAMLRARQAKQRFAPWLVAWDTRRDPDYVRHLNENLQEYIFLLLDLDKTLSAEQRDHAVQKLREFSADFSTLAAEAH